MHEKTVFPFTVVMLADYRLQRFCSKSYDRNAGTRQMEALPPLKVDDELEISLKLDGNGEELNTFLVKEETLGSKETAVEIDFNDLPEETLSDDKEFTDKDNGKLGFKDGVSQTQIGIRAKVQQVTEDGVKLKFYLFSKPVNCEGAKYELEIKTSDKQDD